MGAGIAFAAVAMGLVTLLGNWSTERRTAQNYSKWKEMHERGVANSVRVAQNTAAATDRRSRPPGSTNAAATGKGFGATTSAQRRRDRENNATGSRSQAADPESQRPRADLTASLGRADRPLGAAGSSASSTHSLKTEGTPRPPSQSRSERGPPPSPLPPPQPGASMEPRTSAHLALPEQSAVPSGAAAAAAAVGLRTAETQQSQQHQPGTAQEPSDRPRTQSNLTTTVAGRVALRSRGGRMDPNQPVGTIFRTDRPLDSVGTGPERTHALKHRDGAQRKGTKGKKRRRQPVPVSQQPAGSRGGGGVTRSPYGGNASHGASSYKLKVRVPLSVSLTLPRSLARYLSIYRSLYLNLTLSRALALSA